MLFVFKPVFFTLLVVCFLLFDLIERNSDSEKKSFLSLNEAFSKRKFVKTSHGYNHVYINEHFLQSEFLRIVLFRFKKYLKNVRPSSRPPDYSEKVNMLKENSLFFNYPN